MKAWSHSGSVWGLANRLDVGPSHGWGHPSRADGTNTQSPLARWLQLTRCGHTMSLRTRSHGVQSPIHVNKFQHGGKVPTFEPQETVRVYSWLYYAKEFLGLVVRVGFSFLLNQTLNTSPKSHLQKVLPCRCPCHTWDHVWSGKSQLPCSQQMRLHGLTLSDLELRTWDPGELALSTWYQFVGLEFYNNIGN